LADGNYTATLLAGGISDINGSKLDGNGDGVGGDSFTYSFFVLAGDANHDRTVDFTDLVAVAQNYGATGGMTFDKGDFNYDGSVDFADLVMLAQRYGTGVPAPAAPVPATPTPTPAPALTVAAAAPMPVAVAVNSSAT